MNENSLIPRWLINNSAAQKYIVTDQVAIWAAQRCIETMGGGPLSALLLKGPPGCGKTFLGKMLAFHLEAELLYFQFFRGSGKAELLLEKDIFDQTKYKHGMLPQSINLSHEKKVILLLDEIDKGDPYVDAFLLGFLNDGILNIPQIGFLKANNHNLLVILTMNDEREVSNPLLRRCRCVTMTWPTPEVELKIFLQETSNVPSELGTFLIGHANHLRRHGGVRKPPSPPEVSRLGQDLFNLYSTGVAGVDLGRYLINGLLPIEEDQAFMRDANPLYLGSAIRDFCGVRILQHDEKAE